MTFLERRFGAGMTLVLDDNAPGLVQDPAGYVYLVKPDGSRCLLDCGGGGGNTPDPAAPGDMLYSADGLTWTVLSVGANGEVLTVVAGEPDWAAAGTAFTPGDALDLTGGGVLNVLYDGVTIDLNGSNELEVIAAGVLTDAVILDPLTSARNRINPAVDVVPLSVRASLLQAADLYRIEQSGGSPYWRTTNDGSVLVYGTDAINPQNYGDQYFTVGQNSILLARAGDSYLDSHLSAPYTPGANDTVSGFTMDMEVTPTANGYGNFTFIQGQLIFVRNTGNKTTRNLNGVYAQTIMNGSKAAGSGVQVGNVTGDLVVANTHPGSTGDVDILYGTYTASSHYGQGTVSKIYGVWSAVGDYAPTSGTPGPITTEVAGYVTEVEVGATTGVAIPLASGLKIEAISTDGRAITEARGINIPRIGVGGATPLNIAKSYAVYIAAQQGTTDPWSIYSAGGKSRLDAGAATVTPFTVRGFTSQSADISRVEKMDATPYWRHTSGGDNVIFGTDAINPQGYGDQYYGNGQQSVLLARASDGWFDSHVSSPYTPGANDSVTAFTIDMQSVPTADGYSNFTYTNGIQMFVRNTGTFRTRYVQGLYIEAFMGGTKAAASGNQVGNLFGADVFAYTENASTGDVGTIVGFYGGATHSGRGTVGTMYGSQSAVVILNPSSGTPGPITTKVGGVQASFYTTNTTGTAIPLVSGFELSEISTSGRAITDARGLNIAKIGTGGSSPTSIAVSYAIYIAEQAGTTDPWSIYSAGGKSRLDAGAETVIPLTIRGFTAQSANLFVTEDVSGNDLVVIDSAGKILFGTSADTNLYRSAADTLRTDDTFKVGGNFTIDPSGFWDGPEITAPATPAADHGRLFWRDSGAGKTQLVAKFQSGNTVVIAEDF